MLLKLGSGGIACAAPFPKKKGELRDLLVKKLVWRRSPFFSPAKFLWVTLVQYLIVFVCLVISWAKKEGWKISENHPESPLELGYIWLRSEYCGLGLGKIFRLFVLQLSNPKDQTRRLVTPNGGESPPGNALKQAGWGENFIGKFA